MSYDDKGPGPCPFCGSETVIRTNRRLGVPFYGCTRFPDCKGTRDYDYGIDDDYDDLETDTTQGGTMSPGMKNFNNKLMDRFFKRVNGVVWDLMTGKVGIEGPEGISSLEGEGDEAQVNLNVMEQFGMPVPAFAQSVSIDQVKLNDLIYVQGKPKGWVIEVVEPKAKAKKAGDADADADAKAPLKKFRLMTPNGSSSLWTPPKVAMFGFDSGVMVLKSLGEMLPGGDAGLTGMQGMLMPLMMMGGIDGDGMDKLMPMLLMSQMGGMGGAGAGAGANNMIQMMMMAQMMSGGKGKGNNPFGSFFD